MFGGLLVRSDLRDLKVEEYWNMTYT